jgi:hypothetical protein
MVEEDSGSAVSDAFGVGGFRMGRRLVGIS